MLVCEAENHGIDARRCGAPDGVLHAPPRRRRTHNTARFSLVFSVRFFFFSAGSIRALWAGNGGAECCLTRPMRAAQRRIGAPPPGRGRVGRPHGQSAHALVRRHVHGRCTGYPSNTRSRCGGRRELPKTGVLQRRLAAGVRWGAAGAPNCDALPFRCTCRRSRVKPASRRPPTSQCRRFFHFFSGHSRQKKRFSTQLAHSLIALIKTHQRDRL